MAETRKYSLGQGIPTTVVGYFVFPHEQREVRQIPSRLRVGIDVNIKDKLQGFRDQMMNPYGNPVQHPFPQIPKAAEPYSVNITPISQLERAAKAAERRRQRARRKGRKKSGGGKLRRGLSSLRGRVIKARTRYFTFKRDWVKHWSDRGTGQIVKWRGKTLAERREKRKQKLKKRRESMELFRKTRLGKMLGYGKVRKRSKKPKISFGIDRLFPIRRSRAKSTRAGKIRGRITVQPGRLRRSAGAGLAWGMGSIYSDGIPVTWGIPKIWGGVGKGIVVNYAATVERNPNAGRAEGSGKSPYVKRTQDFIADACRMLADLVNMDYHRHVNVSAIARYSGKDMRVVSHRRSHRQVVLFVSRYGSSSAFKNFRAIDNPTTGR
jgi:hypothetical protein